MTDFRLIVRDWTAVTVLASGVLYAGAPAAARFEVEVLDRAGAALPGAAVCAGTAGDVRQFGARITGDDALAVFDDLPRAPVDITVSLSGYRGIVQRFAPAGFDRRVRLVMVQGGFGPQCPGPEQPRPTLPARAADAGLQVVNAIVQPAAEGAWLMLEFNGPADEVRIGRSADFEGAEWRPLSARIRLNEPPGPAYVQVRRLLRLDGAIIESRSPPKRFQIPR